VDRTVRKFLDKKLQAEDFLDFVRIRDKANTTLNRALARISHQSTIYENMFEPRRKRLSL
jgi:hypothetical protein